MFGKYWKHMEGSGSNFRELPCLDEEKSKNFSNANRWGRQHSQESFQDQRYFYVIFVLT